MTDKIVVLVTAGKLTEARKIARELVKASLAACVNITPAIESIYRWEGKVERAQEYLLIIKSARELFPEIAAEVRKLHSYTTPEIVCLPIVEGAPDYLQWLGDSVRSTRRSV